MGFKEWIIPQDRVFFDLLEKDAEQVRDAVLEFETMINDWNDLEAHRLRLKEIEHTADSLAHEIFDRLTRTFITPLDREDIASLTKRLDDIVDYLHAAGNRMFLYEIDGPNDTIRGFVEILKAQVEKLVPAVGGLRKARGLANVKEICVEINRLENDADRLLNRSLAELYKGGDAVRILKYKDVYEHLENATDRCEDVADVLQDILRKKA